MDYNFLLIVDKCVDLVQSWSHHQLFVNNFIFSPWYSWTIAELALSNIHSYFMRIFNNIDQFPPIFENKKHIL
jgi:hypothetical protein